METIIKTKNNRDFNDKLSLKNNVARIAVTAVVTICDSDANVPADCTRPINLKRMKNPDAKIPARTTYFQALTGVFLKDFINLLLLNKRTKITENKKPNATLCVENTSEFI